MKVAFVYNLRHVKPSLTDRRAQEEAEFDTWETILGIQKAFEKKGHAVSLVETNLDAYEKLRALKGRIDVVFNYSEGVGGQDREAQIPTLLEMLQIPYTGSGPLTSAVLLSKTRTKELLAFHGLATPAWTVVQPEDLADLDQRLGQILSYHTSFPLIVKPNFEGSSKGIFNDSIVSTEKELRKVIRRTIQNYHQAALVENYLPGREFTVAMLQEKDRWRVLPVIEVRFDELPKEMNPIDSYEVKWIYDSPEKNMDPLVCPAKISPELKTAIETTCTKACKSLGILDWCRIDLRLDSRGVPNILEINSPPGLMPDPKENSRYPRAARQAGINFENLLDKILKSALLRYNNSN